MPIRSTAASWKGDSGVISGTLPCKVLFLPLYGLYVIYDLSNGVYGIFYGFINSSRCVPRYFYGLYAILYGFYGTSYGLNSNHRLFMVFPMGLVGCHISYTIYHSNMVSISRFCSMTLVLLRKCSNGLYAVSWSFCLFLSFSLCLFPFKFPSAT